MRGGVGKGKYLLRGIKSLPLCSRWVNNFHDGAAIEEIPFRFLAFAIVNESRQRLSVAHPRILSLSNVDPPASRSTESVIDFIAVVMNGVRRRAESFPFPPSALPPHHKSSGLSFRNLRDPLTFLSTCSFGLLAQRPVEQKTRLCLPFLPCYLSTSIYLQVQVSIYPCHLPTYVPITYLPTNYPPTIHPTHPDG